MKHQTTLCKVSESGLLFCYSVLVDDGKAVIQTAKIQGRFLSHLFYFGNRVTIKLVGAPASHHLHPLAAFYHSLPQNWTVLLRISVLVFVKARYCDIPQNFILHTMAVKEREREGGCLALLPLSCTCSTVAF